MIKLLKLLQETLDTEIAKLKEFGYEVVEKYEISPYTMLLLHNTEEDIYEISLTTGEDDFTTFDAQVKKPPRHQSNFKAIANELVEKVKEWLKAYGTRKKPYLFIGSFNKARTYRYHSIFKKMGLKVGEISFYENENLPDSYDFKVYR